MKKSCITIGLIIGFIFPMSVFALDTLSINTKDSTSSWLAESSDDDSASDKKRNSDDEDHLPVLGNIKSLMQKGGFSTNVRDGINAPEMLERNPLLEYIQNYDINVSRVYPRPARIFSPDDDLDYPKMSPLFMPLVFNAIRRDFKLLDRERKEPRQAFQSPHLDSLKMNFRSMMYIHKMAQSILLHSETQQIGKIKYDQKNLPEPEQLVYHLNLSKPIPWSKPMGLLPHGKVNTKELPKNAYSPWNKDGFVRLQFSQTYNSPNWSKGGESNMAGLTTMFFEVNYTNFKNVQFDNSIETKIGLNTVASDTLRNLNVSTDQLRILSKLGVRMYNDWFYSLSGEFTTQLLNNYKANTMKLKSSFLSPAKLFVGLGVDFKKTNKKKTYNLSVNIAPITCKLNYLKDIVNFKPASYGIEAGDHFGKELGSKLTATLNWKLSDQVQWKSKFYYFTDFTYVDSEWENTVDLNLNHYFATTIFLHLKVNDRQKRDPGDHLLQMQELLSFGMVYRW